MAAHEAEMKLHDWVLLQQRHNFCVTLASSLRWPPNLRGRSSSTRSRAGEGPSSAPRPVRAPRVITKDAVTHEETSTASKFYACIGLFPVDKLLAIASDAELGSAEYRKQLAAKQLAAGVAVDGSALPSLKLTAGEKARIIEDAAMLNLQPLRLLPRVPTAAFKAAAGVDRKMKAGLLIGAEHLSAGG